MILGIGVDIVNLDRIRDALIKHGDRFAERILTPTEYDFFKTAANPAAYLGKRYAAKEAVAKAFGTGFRDGLSLQHIQIINDAQGKPCVVLFDKAEVLMQALGGTDMLISLSDEQEYAIAYATLSANA